MNLPAEQQQFFARFVHPEKLLPPLPGMNNAVLAQLFGLEEAQYEGLLGHLAQVTGSFADTLLEDATSVALIERIASKPLSIVALGDSLTDDSHGWAEILRSAASKLGLDAWTLRNAGISAQGSPDIMARIPEIVASQPDIIVCFAGTNDARRFGDLPGPLLNADVTANVLRAAYDFAAMHSSAKWLWATPVGVDEDKIRGNWLFQASQVTYKAADVKAIADKIIAFGEPVVDLYGCLAGPESGLADSLDGVHPEPAGQVVIAKRILASLGDMVAI